MSCETVSLERRVDILLEGKDGGEDEEEQQVSWWRRNEPDSFEVSRMTLEIRLTTVTAEVMRRREPFH